MRSLWVGRLQDQPKAQRVKDAGESEGQAVMAWIRVRDLPGVKASANAAFDDFRRVSRHEKTG